jgi:nicotinamide-nucleotide amidase
MSPVEEKAQKLLAVLNARRLSLGAVESLTGGLFAATICSIPGASNVFKGAIVSYANSVKIDLVGVKDYDITVFGVVSNKVADDMAVEGRKKLGVDICVSFTGNAGPSVEPGSAPVGRVNMAIATEHGVVSFQQDFVGERNDIRAKCVDMMLDNLETIYGE